MGVLTIVYAVIIFCLLILVHEAGHFVVAKAVGVRVNEFALGMGPTLIKHQGKETKYSVRAFPIGGFVSMEGEDEDSEDPRAFNNKTSWQKALVIVAGSFMNFVTAVVLISIIAFSIGMTSNIIAEVSDGYPAQAAGVLPGDKIVEIEGQEVSTWNQVTDFINQSDKAEIKLVVNRGGELMPLTSQVLINESGRRVIGITSKLVRSPGKSLQAGFGGTVNIAKEMLIYIKQLFTGKGSMDDLMGPVGIVTVIGDQAKLGLIYIVNLTAIISLNLAIVNMLPFPALDGGRLLFLVLGAISGQRISEEVESKIHLTGMLLLFGLMIYLVFQDVSRFILP